MNSHLQAILIALGLVSADRHDDKFTAALDVQLDFIKSKTYDVQYPELKARRLVPVDNTPDPGAENVVYNQWDEYGMADIIANYADDIGMVDALVEKFSQPISSIGKGYQYSIQDLRRAAMTGNQLDARRARAARRAVERKIEDVAAFGDPKGKLKGMLNHPNVPIYTAATDGTDTSWYQGRATPKASDLIIADMNTLVDNVRVTTKEVHTPDALLLSTGEFGFVSQTPVSTLNQATILKSYLANQPFIKGVESWYKLDNANSTGDGPRMMAYQRDPEVLELIIPQEFEQFPPQARNLAFVVPCHARVGGVIFYYPLGAAYMDGIG